MTSYVLVLCRTKASLADSHRLVPCRAVLSSSSAAHEESLWVFVLLCRPFSFPPSCPFSSHPSSPWPSPHRDQPPPSPLHPPPLPPLPSSYPPRPYRRTSQTLPQLPPPPPPLPHSRARHVSTMKTCP